MNKNQLAINDTIIISVKYLIVWWLDECEKLFNSLKSNRSWIKTGFRRGGACVKLGDSLWGFYRAVVQEKNNKQYIDFARRKTWIYDFHFFFLDGVCKNFVYTVIIKLTKWVKRVTFEMKLPQNKELRFPDL